MPAIATIAKIAHVLRQPYASINRAAAIAKNAAEKVKEYGEPVRLEPMSAFERKCVHDVINALAGVESESEGVEPQRRIVVRAVD